jgi:hypothetical protein
LPVLLEFDGRRRLTSPQSSVGADNGQTLGFAQEEWC